MDDTARKARAETERAVARTAEGVRREAIEAAKVLRAEILGRARAEHRRSVRALQVQWERRKERSMEEALAVERRQGEEGLGKT